MTGPAITTTIEEETHFLWVIKGELAAAVAAGDKEEIAWCREDFMNLISVTESKRVKTAAWRALATAETKVLSGSSNTVLPFVRRVVPGASAALALVMAACSLASTPSMTDPPMDLPTEVAIVVEQPSCAPWIDTCE